ncbi:MAG: DMP19 family protein [Gemmatimonadota bacterium]|nr:DMP19 family protein [Gemmatimonadota bacterium]
MTYSPEEASHDLKLIADNTASFETRARLEHHLLTLLREKGNEAVATFLYSLPEHDFKSVDDSISELETQFVTTGSSPRHFVVTTFRSPHLASVNVTIEDESSAPPEPDPRHRAFYEVWESLLGIPDSEVSRLDPERKAVFLVGLLEAEVMNGGIGQYLSNTDGAHLEDTVRCLLEIGAEKACAILMEAAKLGMGSESYGAAWASKSRDFERLDDQFMESGEDLAGLTAEVFIDRSTRSRGSDTQ